MDVVAYLPADPQPAEPVQVGKRALDDPASGSQSRAVFCSPARDQRLDSEIPDQATVFAVVVVVAAVGEDDVRATPGPASLPSH
ncbi:hypothetical protein K377_08041 [Streptomyces sp. PsTaAH-137]|nr:hypothetical protein K377_08041 [Streptomyces sp. PsTaAH-137]